MFDWLTTHQRLVNATAAAATVAAVSRTALLAFPEPLPWMAELGDVVYDLSLAWITAWAFQLWVIVIPEESERKRFEARVAPRVDRLLYLGLELQATIAAHAKSPAADPTMVDRTLVSSVCDSDSVGSPAPRWLGDWGTVLRHFGTLANKRHASLRPFYVKLPVSLLDALDQEELAMEDILRMERFSRAFSTPDMKRLTDPLMRWLESIEQIEQLRLTTFAPEVSLPERPDLSSDQLQIPLEDFIRQHEDFMRSVKDEASP